MLSGREAYKIAYTVLSNFYRTRFHLWVFCVEKRLKENKWKYLTCVAGLRDFLGSSTGIPSFPLALLIVMKVEVIDSS